MESQVLSQLKGDLDIAAQILRRVQEATALGQRMKLISAQLRGCPYVENPLIGSADSNEVFTFSLKEFDCVTYVETVLALAWADSVQDFIRFLRLIRYKDGQVGWHTRNHYMTEWIRNNARSGFVKNLTRGPETIVKTKTLNVIQGLGPRTVTFRCFPKKRFPTIRRSILQGDVIFFASTRRNLDIFHVGIIFPDKSPDVAEETEETRILLSHASRSRGGVIEQDLTEFFKETRMAGFLLVRPLKRADGSSALVSQFRAANRSDDFARKTCTR